MLDSIEEFKRLNDLAEKQKEEKARAKGSMDTIAKSLKDKGFKSPADAEKKIAEMKKNLEAHKKKFNQKVEEFKERYSEYL